MKISAFLFLALAIIVDGRLPVQPPPMQFLPTMDFSEFAPGQIIDKLPPAVTVETYKRVGKRGPLVDGISMIFDSSNPTGGDVDLGSPHRFFGGPGVGRGGHPNKSLFANRLSHGNVLIISTDGNSSEPNDHKYGGQMIFTFEQPMPLKSIGILDNNKGSTIEATLMDQSSIFIDNGKHRNNSFDRVYLAKEAPVIQLIITLEGSGAITDMQFGPLVELPPIMPPLGPDLPIIPTLPGFPRVGYVRNCDSETFFCGLSPADMGDDSSLVPLDISTQGTTVYPLPYPECLAGILTPMCDNKTPMDGFVVGVCDNETNECLCCDIAQGIFNDMPPQWFPCSEPLLQ